MLKHIASLLLLLCSALAMAQETGFLNRAVRVEGTEFRYQVYVPRDYKASGSWPVILALHGGGEYGLDGLKQTDGGLARAIRLHPERFPAIVVFPQSHPGLPGFQAVGGQVALAALDASVREFRGDLSRVYLTGFSAGGNGAYSLAYNFPERFAALVVVCGFVDEFTGTTSGTHYPPIVAGSENAYAAIAQRLARMPLRIFHGDADMTVSVDVSRRIHAALKAAGADVQYVEFPGVPHNAWDAAYDRADLIAWMLQQRRK